MNKLVLFFNFEHQIFEYHLPAVNNRKMTFDLIHRCTLSSCKVDFEVWDNRWVIQGNEDITLYENGVEIDNRELEGGLSLQVYRSETDEYFAILVLQESENMSEFHKYDIAGCDEISIGSSSESSIRIDENFVSRSHALLYRKGQSWFIKDTSTNGTYLNTKRILGDTELKKFDCIYIFGSKIICIDNVLAINNLKQTYVNLKEINRDNFCDFERIDKPEDYDGYFSRSPRSMEPLLTEGVDIEAPPANQKNKKQPLLFIFGPSLTMPIPIMLSVLFNINANTGASNPTMYLGTLISVFSSGIIGALWALAHQRYDKKEQDLDEKERVDGYVKYIKKNKDLLEDKQDKNRKILNLQYANSTELIHILDKKKYQLWNRNINHTDFLTLRLGTGKIKSPVEISIPKERFSLTDDELQEKPRELYKAYKNIDNAASLISIKNVKLIGVIGTHDKVMDIARSLVIQLAALHCYTDVKLVFIFGNEDRKFMEWVKWLPHSFSSDRRMRYLADDTYSYQNVLYALVNEIRTRTEEEKNRRKIPHYVVFLTESELIEKEAIYSYMTSTEDYGFTFVLLYDQMNRLPNECKYIIENSENYTGCYSLEESKQETNEITFDIVSDKEASEFARSLSGIYVNETAGGEMPNSIDFLEMYHIGNIEQWDLVKRYKENRVYEGISAFVGVTNGNKPVYLDIHEKKYGPHGLVAGTTGSGKSETLMTFILSLAMNYHPDEVAFVLIDYKGGGMASPFMSLPHIAGTITNIGDGELDEGVDETQTRRALVSIKSEIRRRQKIFNKYNVNHIDTYIKLYRDGQAKEALPHLIIISDEFAELKKEQPEFIKELVSAARVGRSLGIHLILATQKPAGVVDDEIWSNSRFKICLRVQDKQDSMGMLKRPDAAYLTGTGRAYLQIGNDEIFELFQSGYAGADYVPTEKLELSQHSEVSMIGLDGNPLVVHTKRRIEGAISQLEACINYIVKITEQEHIKPTRKLWLPPLPRKLYLSQLEQEVNKKEGDILVTIGLVDRPELQQQNVVVFDLLQTANILIQGNIGTGKTTTILTLIHSLVTRYTSDEINVYCLDFSSRMMRLFNILPHCGGVAFAEEEEKISHMIRVIRDLMKERQKIFDELNVGNITDARKIQKIPLILLVIDNYVILRENYSEIEESVGNILREGVKYGVQVVASITGENDIGYKNKQNFSQYISLYLGEKGRYVDAIGQIPEILPYNTKGRGLINYNGIGEFQVALPVEGDDIERTEKLQAIYSEVADKNTGKGIVKVRTIPKDESFAEFTQKNVNEDPAIGYDMDTIEPIYIPLEKIYVCNISSNSKEAVINVIKNITYALEQKSIPMVVWADKGNYVEYGEWVDTEKDDFVNHLVKVREEFVKRSNYRKQGLEDGKNLTEIRSEIRKEFGERFIVIPDLGQFCNSIYSNDYEEPVTPLLEVLIAEGMYHGIYFVIGSVNEGYYQIVATKFGKAALGYHYGLHMGGRLDQQNIYDVKLSIGEQMVVTDDNVGYVIDERNLKKIYIPMA